MTAPLRSSDSAGRRTFIKTAAAAGVVLAGWKPTLGRGGVLQKLNVASIGVGGMGASDLSQIASHPEVTIVGLCDTDANNLGKAGVIMKSCLAFATQGTHHPRSLTQVSKTPRVWASLTSVSVED